MGSGSQLLFDTFAEMSRDIDVNDYAQVKSLTDKMKAATDLLEALQAFIDLAPSDGHRCLCCGERVYDPNNSVEHSPDCEMSKGYAAIAKARGEK